MKRIYFVISCIAFLYVFQSCLKDDITKSENQGSRIQLYAIYDDTKTQLSADGFNVLWSPDDAISVFFGNTKGVCFNSLNSDTTAATIFQSVTNIMFAQGENSHAYRYAFYPYSQNNVIKDGKISSELPSTHIALPGTFQSGHFPSVSRSLSDTLRFYNICGGIAVSVASDDIYRIEFDAGRSPVAGKFNVSFDQDGLPVSTVTDTASVCVLETEDGDLFESGCLYYLPALPCYIDSLKITFRKESGFYADTTIFPKKSIARSCYAKIDSIDTDLKFMIDVASVSLDKHQLELSSKGSDKLSAEVLPYGADPSVKWLSTDSKIAQVDENGVVTAKDTSGTCKIIVSSVQNPAFTDTCTVTVVKHVESLKVSQDSVKLWVDSTCTLTATIFPEGATEKRISWVSTAETVAKVSSEGEITAVSLGECLIIAMSVEDNTIRDSCKVKVVVPVSNISLSSTALNVFVDDVFQLKAIVTPLVAEDRSLIWSSSDSLNVAKVSATGYVTAVGSGTCTITATSRMNPSVSASCTINVINATDLSAKGYANCYIVPGYGYYKIKAVGGNGGIALGSVASAEVLWQGRDVEVYDTIHPIIDTIILKKEYVYFRIADYTDESISSDGNAVIAVRNSSGTVLWSWHIWSLKNYDPDKSSVDYNNNAGTVMDRNLGCCCTVKGDFSSTGMFYQWGRKDPFPPKYGWSLSKITSATWPSPVTSDSQTGTIDYAVKNPMTFILRNGNNRDWFYSESVSGANRTRWNGDKTDYDPCPYGWKVPAGDTKGLWSTACGSTAAKIDRKFDTANFGMDFQGFFTDENTPCWYCATGYYSGQDMSYASRGGYVAVWSSTHPSGVYYGFSLYCYADTARCHYGADCADGRAVRCVKDE